MRVLHDRCAGIDIHKDMVVACLRVQGSRHAVEEEVRTFATTTADLIALADWLEAAGCTHVVMEATGDYWKPVWHILEERVMELVLANPHDVKAVPGRKTDVKDAVWLAQLLAHGLVRNSFVPPRPIQELRDLTRLRKQLVGQRTQVVQRIQKVLVGANIQIASFLSDITGDSGRRVLAALATGERDPAQLVLLISTRVKAKRSELVAALRGYVTEHQQFMLRFLLDQLDAADQAIGKLEAQAELALRPFRSAADRLKTIPGVGELAARVILAEVGDDMSKFAAAANLVSWAGLCPRNDQSAGRHRSTRVRHGNAALKHILVQAAWAAVRNKTSYERALYFRIKSRAGGKKAIVAVAASMLKAAYYILRDGVEYRSLGPDHFTKLNPDRAKERHVQALKRLGFEVELKVAG
jgi:transposase